MTTSGSYVEWRAYIGPPWRRDDATDFWDWSSFPAAWQDDSTIAPHPTYITSDLEPGATSVVLADKTGFLITAGGIWVGGNAAGEMWEYITYTDITGLTCVGCTREAASDELNSHHSTGAVVRFWWPITTDDGELEITESIDDTLTAVTWQAKMGGVTIPQAAIRNRHLVLIQTRVNDANGAMGLWTNELFGWLMNPEASDDYKHEGAWTVQILSSAGMLALLETPGVHVGQLNVAVQSNASASPQLAAPYKEYNSGAFTAAEPDLGPANAIDGRMTTLYMSERNIQSAANKPPDPGSDAPAYSIDQVHVSPYDGQGDGARWIQIVGPGAYRTPRLANQNKVFPELYDKALLPNDTSFDYRVPKLILCEHKPIFEMENPGIDSDWTICELGGTTIRNMNHYTGAFGEAGQENSAVTIAEWWDSLLPAGAALHLEYGSQWDCGMVTWGTMGTLQLSTIHAWDPIDWSGTSLVAPAAGQTMWRNYTVAKGSAEAWYSSRISTPGYWMDGTTPQWLRTMLRPIGLRLRDALTADIFPMGGGTVYVTSDLGDSVNGLGAAGTIQIATEQMPYTAKVEAGGQLTGVIRGVAPLAHAAGDQCFVLEGTVATNAIGVKKIVLRQKAGQPTVKDFKLYASRSMVARVPSDAGFANDYDLLAQVTNNVDEAYTYTLAPTSRYRQILVVVTATGATGRLVIPELQVIADDANYDTSSLLAADSTAAQLAGCVLDLCGIPTGAQTLVAGTPALDNVTTERGSAWRVLTDLADYAGCRITVARDSKITFQIDPLWSISDPAPAADYSWDDSDIASIRPNWRTGLSVGQMRLKWISGDGESGGVAYYPATPDTVGQQVDAGPYVCASAAAALVKAHKLYWIRRAPYGDVLEMGDPTWSVRPGMIISRTWPLDSTMLDLDRTYMVRQATHRISKNALTDVFYVQQLGREDEL